MSIASELTALNGYILGAYDEISDKGGTVPQNKNMANLASAIASISGGGGGGISGLYTGVITIADESSQDYATISGAFPSDKGQPKMCILYEMNTADSDTGADTSGTRFPKYYIARRNSATSSGIGTSSVSYYMTFHAKRYSGGSYSDDNVTASVSGIFYQNSSASNWNVYAFCKGSAGTGNLYFGTGGTYGLRTGRSYRWIVIIESELDA